MKMYDLNSDLNGVSVPKCKLDADIWKKNVFKRKQFFW